jgi:ankyrin repeat protein
MNYAPLQAPNLVICESRTALRQSRAIVYSWSCLRQLLILIGCLSFGAAVQAESPLLDALKSQNFEHVSALIIAGADVNATFVDGKTALMVVGKRGMADLVEQLLNAGAEVNAANNNGGTALMFAAISGDMRTISLLLGRGAAVDAVGANLWGAMMLAAVKGHAELVATFLQRGADPNLPDVYDWTPLMRAASRNRIATVRLLLDDKRTDIARRDDDGATALHRAAKEGHLAMVELLVELGADVRAHRRNARFAGGASANRTPLIALGRSAWFERQAPHIICVREYWLIGTAITPPETRPWASVEPHSISSLGPNCLKNLSDMSPPKLPSAYKPSLARSYSIRIEHRGCLAGPLITRAPFAGS